MASAVFNPSEFVNNMSAPELVPTGPHTPSEWHSWVVWKICYDKTQQHVRQWGWTCVLIAPTVCERQWLSIPSGALSLMRALVNSLMLWYDMHRLSGNQYSSITERPDGHDWPSCLLMSQWIWSYSLECFTQSRTLSVLQSLWSFDLNKSRGISHTVRVRLLVLVLKSKCPKL